MGWISTDLRDVKRRCCELIDAMKETAMEKTRGIVADPERMQQLHELTTAFPVEHYKLMMLLKSQLMCGDYTGSKKFIERLPNRHYSWWVQLCLWPFVAVARFTVAVFSALRPIWKWGKL